ncbi:MAG: hypothetical protein JXM73_07445, partial [Anaerolineae bacterium]|nr:hypothetical protein [Anaerolineae bacterium]
PPGTPVYAQADSADAGTTYGAIRELDEIRGLPYNNILGPVYSAPGRGLTPKDLPLSRAKKHSLSRLPKR